MSENHKPKPAEVLFAEKKIMVRHEPWAKAAGLKIPVEAVGVRVLPFRLLNEMLLVCDDDAKLAALYCGRPLDWTDTLSEESLIEILKVGEELNRPRLAAFVLRKNERVSGLLYGLSENAGESLGRTGETR